MEREQDVVPLRKEANGRNHRVRGRERRPRDVEELTAVLVAETAQWFEELERRGDLGGVHHAPRDHVAPRRRPEGRQVAAQHLGPRLHRDVLVRLVEGDEPAVGTRTPQRSLVMVDEICGGPHVPPGTRGGEAAEIVIGEPQSRLGRRRGSAVTRWSVFRITVASTTAPLASARSSVSIRKLVVRVRRRRPLGLHPDQALDHRRRGETLPLQQELPRERRRFSSRGVSKRTGVLTYP